ncbi:MAG: phosphonate ABC transporter, permease protein PhnE [Pseudomonadota bacterium]|nr:phosphonate ABC transporter, permease protein PhnE [Pseudomonadota bacterium]
MALVGVIGTGILIGFEPALALLAIEPSAALASESLAIIAMFLVMGNLAHAGGLSAELYRLADDVFGHFKGGLIYATIGTCAGFGAISGSSVATTATMARVALPEMLDRGYARSIAAGAIAAGGTLGMIIPPSLVLILYGVLTENSIIALFLAVPTAFMAARNTTPSTVFVRPIALLIIVSTRSINSLIWALLLIAIIGPGVFAGVVAIAIRSIGFCAKLLYEAIEEINEVQVEAITATGASRWQVMVYGIVPQILPAFAGIAVFRWDINIRESTVLGLVGAGGIGLQLSASLNVLAWPQVSLILIVILFAVVISEWVSAKVRGAII